MAFARPKTAGRWRRTPRRKIVFQGSIPDDVSFSPSPPSIHEYKIINAHSDSKQKHEDILKIKETKRVVPSRPPRKTTAKPMKLPPKIVNLTSDYLISNGLIKKLADIKMQTVEINAEIQKNETISSRYQELALQKIQEHDKCKLLEKKIWRWIELMWKPTNTKRTKKKAASPPTPMHNNIVSRPPGVKTSIKTERGSIESTINTDMRPPGLSFKNSSSAQRLQLYLTALSKTFNVEQYDDNKQQQPLPMCVNNIF